MPGARRLLGRPHALRGRVVRGARGRLRLPTANLTSSRRVAPPDGVYLSWSTSREEPRRRLNIGVRPPSPAGGAIEAHLPTAATLPSLSRRCSDLRLRGEIASADPTRSAPRSPPTWPRAGSAGRDPALRAHASEQWLPPGASFRRAAFVRRHSPDRLWPRCRRSGPVPRTVVDLVWCASRRGPEDAYQTLTGAKVEVEVPAPEPRRRAGADSLAYSSRMSTPPIDKPPVRSSSGAGGSSRNAGEALVQHLGTLVGVAIRNGRASCTVSTGYLGVLLVARTARPRPRLHFRARPSRSSTWRSSAASEAGRGRSIADRTTRESAEESVRSRRCAPALPLDRPRAIPGATLGDYALIRDASHQLSRPSGALPSVVGDVLRVRRAAQRPFPFTSGMAPRRRDRLHHRRGRAGRGPRAASRRPRNGPRRVAPRVREGGEFCPSSLTLSV